MQTVALVDYGSGNLRSAEKALRKAAADLSPAMDVVVTDDPKRISGADRVVLPGVGAFAACKAALEARSGVMQALEEAVRGRAAPFLGICVGMQLMATRGLEFRQTAGLDWIAGDARALAPADRRCKIPHMGWNALEGEQDDSLFVGLAPGTHMYFTHSFAFYPHAPGDVAAWSDHGGRFPAAVMRDNLAGVQFHPEKSQDAGARLLVNFLRWRP
ncbi:MAG TPA: imidazole glycerol phosphate synthase subunit HisH [Caulobacteraceae bacterium]